MDNAHARIYPAGGRRVQSRFEMGPIGPIGPIGDMGKNLLSTGQFAQLACVLEATAHKPGNVSRFFDFEDLTYLDFVLSAAAIAPVMDRSAEIGVGRTVLEALEATRRCVGTNSNLGMLLLLAPLAAVPAGEDLEPGVEHVLSNLTIDDSRYVFAAIRLANPGGIGDAPQQDVRGEPTLPLREVMALAADRDSIARQYANGFCDVFDLGLDALNEGLSVQPSLPALRGGGVGVRGSGSSRGLDESPLPPQSRGEREAFERPAPLERAIIHCHLRFMAAFPDSHIARRCGGQVAEEARRRAARVLNGQ